jgi:hypothetical protein
MSHKKSGASIEATRVSNENDAIPRSSMANGGTGQKIFVENNNDKQASDTG